MHVTNLKGGVGMIPTVWHSAIGKIMDTVKKKKKKKLPGPGARRMNTVSSEDFQGSETIT